MRKALIALLIACWVPAACGVPRAHAARPARLNCVGYTLGMGTLARDVSNFAARSGGLTMQDAAAQAHGVSQELARVLQANGKPVDNFKVVGLLRLAIGSIQRAVQARVIARNATLSTRDIGSAMDDLANVHILLDEICLPSKIVRLPCSNPCILRLVGSGRVRPNEHNVFSFITPPDYSIQYSWNCARAYIKGIEIYFQDFSNGIRGDPGPVTAFGAGVRGSRSVVRDSETPMRKLLQVETEQACMWQIAVTKQ